MTFFDHNSIPNQFIHNGIFFTKEFDGMFKGWHTMEQYSEFNSAMAKGDYKKNLAPTISIHIREAVELLNSSAFKQPILNCGSNMSYKL
jgi:hypothetical protein